MNFQDNYVTHSECKVQFIFPQLTVMELINNPN